MKLISIVIPIFNEEGNIQELYKRLTAAINQLKKYSFEVIFVNDGSSDNTEKLIAEICKQDKRFTGICFSRNFGHQIALTAGIDYSKGDAVISMDGDLQHPPELIGKLIELWEEGNDIVFTVRQETEKTSLFKKLTARMFYFLINKLTNTEINHNAADFRLMSRRSVDALKSLRERFRFIRGMVSWIGFPQTSVSFTVEERFSGKSKYTFKKMVKFAFDGITSFSSFPLRLAFYIGIIMSIISIFIFLFYVVLMYYEHNTVPGWASLMSIMLFFCSVILIILGIIGEYIARIYEEIKERPLYLIKEIYNKDRKK